MEKIVYKNVPKYKISDIKDKIVLLRVDLNVPTYENEVLNDYKIKVHIETIKNIIKHAKKVILITHLGKTKFKYHPKFKVDILIPILERYLNERIEKLEGKPHKNLKEKIEISKNKLFLMENIRFYEEEQRCEDVFSINIASLGDVYVNDSFGTAHRKHSSTYGVAQFIPYFLGDLFIKEIKTLQQLFISTKSPFSLVLGGTNIKMKMNIIKNFIDNADYFLLGGGVANSALFAQGYDLGMSYVEKRIFEDIQYLMLEIESKNDKIYTPIDVKVSDSMGEDVPALDIKVEGITYGMKVFDIGKKTFEKYTDILKKSRTILWTGPLGVIEHDPFKNSTLEFANFLSTLKNKDIIIGGSATLNFIMENNIPLENIKHLSSGGGAMLKLLAHEKLYSIEALKLR